MRIPGLRHPQRYQGLYLYDFGDHVAVGYTAEEIEFLLASAEYRHGTAYHIHQATPDGQLALRGYSGVPAGQQEAVVFHRHNEARARADFEDLQRRALRAGPPAAVHWHLVHDPQAELPHFTILLYPAAWSEAIGRWLEEIGFGGGDRVDGGHRAAASYRAAAAAPRAVVAIAPAPGLRSRARAEVLDAVGEALQRDL